MIAKQLVVDVLDELDAASISVPDKLEGLAVDGRGHAYLVTDNDGLDENYGETLSVQVALDGNG
ncbi:MAG: esterase-like activity of phytase family protein [Acidimicrobiia bacterium]|nr:esterase-like activity of phytase family protein [Acidimicrobiia bacterium]